MISDVMPSVLCLVPVSERFHSFPKQRHQLSPNGQTSTREEHFTFTLSPWKISNSCLTKPLHLLSGSCCLVCPGTLVEGISLEVNP